MILDRIEGETAVLELKDGSYVKLPAVLLPADAKEGDVLRLTVDSEATQARKQGIKEKMHRLFCD